MKRREFITLLGGAAAAWPLVVRAQQDRIRRIGVLSFSAENDSVTQTRGGKVFRESLQDLGWTAGRNVFFLYRWAAGDTNLVRKDELVESMLHLIGYVGAPLVREALITAKEVFAEMRAEEG
jgi:putative ABC transport system substrate-binding protein